METNNRVDSLLHLYLDGALNRRELVRRLTQATGTTAAALAAIEAAGLANAQTASCPDGVKVAESDPAIRAQTLTIHGEGGPLFIYQALPADYASRQLPAVVVIHENRGLNEHIKDVTRRFAKAGYVAVGVDLLSRQGGTHQFPDAEAAGAAFNRTTVDQRRQDTISAILTIRDQSYVRRDRIGVIGFCAGGAGVFEVAMNTDALAAAVVFYGAPPNPIEQVERINAPLLGFYGEMDRNTNARVPALLTTMMNLQKRFALHVYWNARHAFHNDTGAAYDAAAACDAWSKTLAFFNLNLNAARNITRSVALG
jgi:carboxymethylenebutenolidase